MKYKILTGLVGPQLLDRDHRHGRHGTEFQRPELIAEDRHGAWRERQHVFELAFEQRPSCHGPSFRISSLRATSLERNNPNSNGFRPNQEDGKTLIPFSLHGTTKFLTMKTVYRASMALRRFGVLDSDSLFWALNSFGLFFSFFLLASLDL